MKKVKPFVLLLIFLAIIASRDVFAQYNCQQTKSLHIAQTTTPPINNNAKSDTFDILHYDLNLDFTTIQNGTFSGVCNIKFTPKINIVSQLNLELVALVVDSVKLTGYPNPTYSYNSGPNLVVTLPQAVNPGDTLDLQVFYGGTPVTDQSGWGGFHRANPYFYNLGVGFAANPHTFGRAWFPCFDNFVEKSTYTFAIKTAGGQKAYCNGIRTLLDSTTFGGDTVVSHWQLTEPIPTYLASVAISNYQELSWLHNNKPFLLLARAGDTANAKSSFANLNAIYDAEVAGYGPYLWQKVGYALTTVGAMEHATSIHYPRNIVDGTLAYEDIIAHELAHHWFGNLITCETAGDMWINEGMAEYVSHQYQEIVYNRQRYLDVVLANQALVLQYAAVRDGSHLPLVNLANEETYGTHTYQKGAMVAHNLRTYLGDSAFFNGLKTLLANNLYGSLNTQQFRDQLSAITGYNLNPFFTDWILNPGYPEFNVDSMRVILSAIPEPTVKVGVSHRMYATNKRYSHVPLKITLRDSLGQQQEHMVHFAGNDTVFTLSNAFVPSWCTINENGFLLDATAAKTYKIKNNGFFGDNVCKMNVVATSVPDSATLRIEHHWAGPSTTGNEPFRLSKSRYWRVTGHLPSGFLATATLDYSNYPNTGSLDADLVSVNEDSIMLVYRKDATQPWQEYAFYTKNIMGSSTNGAGRMLVSLLKKGEYAFANGVSQFAIDEEDRPDTILISPNPATNWVRISIPNQQKAQHYLVIDAGGKTIAEGDISGAIDLEISQYAPGTYFFYVAGRCEKFVVVK